MRIYLIILMYNMTIGCSENKGDQNESDWRDEYGIIEGTGAIQGQVNGDVSGLEFTLISLSTDSITMIELLSDNKFTILNLLPGYYNLNVYTTSNITILDSIPVKPDSLTIIEEITHLNEFYHGWEPPPIPNMVMPLGTTMANKTNWVLKPISYLFNKN
ncbi:MAG: hypothetical protein GWP19_02805 [Planctomycetia bacterium]|nr:hypothetical protein [Planctomycetia bacterium]